MSIENSGVAQTNVPWVTIEDSDPRWEYDGLTSKPNNWNASGREAKTSFRGTAIQCFAYRNPTGGHVTVSLDAIERGTFDLKSKTGPEGAHYVQHYVKVFEALDLDNTKHTVVITYNPHDTQKTIDMLSVMESE